MRSPLLQDELEAVDVADSEPHAVKFLGMLQLETTREALPDGAVCVKTIKTLQRRRRRDRFRNGVDKDLTLQVSCGRGVLLCAPNGGGRGLRVPLHTVVCVADYHEFVCCVTSSGVENGVVLCDAMVFQVRVGARCWRCCLR